MLPSAPQTSGSDIAIGINRLRAGFAQQTNTPKLTGSVALLASESKNADALASGVLQQAAPLYLTQTDQLEPAVLAELQRSGVREVWLLGGPQALSPGVEQALQRAGFQTRRIAGADRTQTAAAIAQAANALDLAEPTTRFIARAFGDQGDETRSWADAIALGGLAAKTNNPVFLSSSTQLSASVGAQLAKGMPTVIIGGQAAITGAVESQVQARTGQHPRRLAGLNRADTAALIARQFVSPKRAIVIDGQGKDAWQLGFTLAGLSRDLNAPILLASGDIVPAETQRVLKELAIKDTICIGSNAMCATVKSVTN